MPELTVPAFIRGTLVSSDLVSFSGRGGEMRFRAPEPSSLLDRLPLREPGALRAVQSLSTEEVVDYLAELGKRLTLSRNEFLTEALELSSGWSDLTHDMLRASYERLPSLFGPDSVREVAEHMIGTRYLDGWCPLDLADGHRVSVRAVGARCVHLIAGNNPVIAAITIIRNALTRGDSIVKLPSNDLLSALAIARTMGEMAPGHPLTQHLSVAYWKGGDERFERGLYQPGQVEKIIAWGGHASIRHVVPFIRPGLELISFDPKLSATVVGREGFTSFDTMVRTAKLAARDVGGLNQLGCVNARVIYVEASAERADEWADLLYRKIQQLPTGISTPSRRFDPELRARLTALRTDPDKYQVVGGHGDEGAIIVSRCGEPVDFYPSLSGRVANVVPVPSVSSVIARISSETQTVGIYPNSLKEQLRDVLPLHGAQRIVSLGNATTFRPEIPWDALEPVRRMVKWVTDETYD